jgi:hypothetical protein
VELRLLKPCYNRSVLLEFYDLTGAKLTTYLFKVTAELGVVSQRMVIPDDHNIHCSFLIDNPYPCPCLFTLHPSTRLLELESDKCALEGYESKAITARMPEWGYCEPTIFIMAVDEQRRVVVKTAQIDHDPSPE